MCLITGAEWILYFVFIAWAAFALSIQLSWPQPTNSLTFVLPVDSPTLLGVQWLWVPGCLLGLSHDTSQHKPAFSLLVSIAVQHNWLVKFFSLHLQELQSIPPCKAAKTFNPQFQMPLPTHPTCWHKIPVLEQFTFPLYRTVGKAECVPNTSSARRIK